MKKIIIAMAAIAAFTMASCNKELVEPENNPIEGNSIITASTESNLTKTSLSGDDKEGYEVVWSEGDTFKIGDNTFTLIEGAGTTTGKFQGTLPEGDGPFIAYYPAEYNGTDWSTTQVYTEGNITGSPMKAEVVKGAESLSFKNAGGILRLKVKGSEDILVASITVSASGLEDITLNCGDGIALDATEGAVFHIAMPEGSYAGTSILLTTADGKSCTKTLKTSTKLEIERSKITPASFTAGSFKTLAPEGALPELFTVSADGKKVFFSKGNLWCDTETDPSASNFHFEDNQYDITPAKSADRDINHISHFMWCRSAADAVKPEYSETGNSTDDILFTNAAGFTVNGLANWYAPSRDEMYYLMEKRKASTVGGTANARYFCGRIDKGADNYIMGMFFIPDVFTWPESDVPAAPQGINRSPYNFTDNTYSVSEFAILQQAGLVFLPCAGSRDSGYTKVYYVDNSGYYWYSTLKDADNARHFGVSTSSTGADYANQRSRAYSIRLVTDLSDNPVPTFSVTFDMNGHGTAPAAIDGVRYRSTIAQPSNPEAAGFAFAGWYRDKGCKTKWNFSSDVVTANTTLYAGWIELPDGALSGKFTVNASGEQIVFSRGNVWYGTLDYDGPVYNIPYGYYFEAGQCVSVPSVFSGQNLYTRDKYHVSHFYWTKEAFYSYHGYTPYQDNYGEYTTSPTDILFTDQSDFTVNEQKGLWRALTKEECDYLFNQRTMTGSTSERYTNFCSGITISNRVYYGIFIYPDDYSGPLVKDDGTIKRWGDVNDAGIVFLPAGGYRSGTTVYNNGYAGEYLLNSPESSDAYALTFSRDNGPAVSSRSRTRGCSIRLVMDLSGDPAPSYTVTFDANGHGTAPAELKNVPYGSTITKPSDPTADAYIFWGWYKDKACTVKWDLANDVVTSDITLYALWRIDGTLPGTFTVNDSGTKVYFSKGNLWYGKTSEGAESATFNFEENQYDYCVIWDEDSKEKLRDDNHVSHFMWSKDAVVSCALTYNDSSASESDVFFTNADQITPNPDFTANGQKGLWRILSKNEWIYLINQNGCLWTTIDGINGLIIFCDGYIGSRTGLTEIPDGCVFLPAAGYRSGYNGLTSIYVAGTLGFYWSASSYNNTCAWELDFGSFGGNPDNHGDRDRARSVRLVTDVKE